MTAACGQLVLKKGALLLISQLLAASRIRCHIVLVIDFYIFVSLQNRTETHGFIHLRNGWQQAGFVSSAYDFCC